MSDEQWAQMEKKLKELGSSFEFDNEKEVSKYINFPIDTPFTGDLSERKFFMQLLENETYKKQYYSYLDLLARKYILGGTLISTMDQIMNEIRDINGTENNAFYSNDKFLKAKDCFKTLLEKKALSVIGQMKGVIPSTRDGQEKDSSNLIKGDGILLSDLGTLDDAE